MALSWGHRLPDLAEPKQRHGGVLESLHGWQVRRRVSEMVVEKQTQKSYQRALRVIGQYLDRRPSRRVSITEQPDGFEVCHTMKSRPKPFTWDDIDEVDLEKNDGHEAAADGYAGRLRKRGLILDHLGATSVTIRETEEGRLKFLDVSYTDDSGQERQDVYGPE
jgi:hypothetical protein